jgi:hypothetical protein
MKQNIIREKSFGFAVRMVRLFQHLQTERKEFVLSKKVMHFIFGYGGLTVGNGSRLGYIRTRNGQAGH